MKTLGNTVSIFKDTNLVYSCSDADWSGIREGSYFKLSKDNVFYVVGKTSKVYFIKDFEVISPTKLKINSNIGPNLIQSDSLTLSFKEFELLTLVNIINGGEGYKENDIITINSGQVSTDVKSGITNQTTFNVLKVSNVGAILELGPNTKGKYLRPPEIISPIIDGNGNGAVLEVEYRLIDDRALLERTVANIEIIDSQTFIYLDYPLIAGLTSGKLSLEKWRIELTQPYINDNAIHENYEICRDFTPYYKLPLAARGSFKMDVLHNQSMIILDERIGELEDLTVSLQAEIKSLKT